MGIFDAVTSFLKGTASNLILDKDITIKQFNETAIDDYFRSYLFKVDIVAPIGDFKGEWVATTQTPVMVTSVQNIDYMHAQIRQAGRTTPQQWQVTVRDDANGKAFKYFNDWRNLVYPNIKSVTPERYKGSVILTLMSPSMNTRIYSIIGVWPFELGAITLDYDSENISTFPVTLSFDYFDIIPLSNILISTATNIATGR